MQMPLALIMRAVSTVSASMATPAMAPYVRTSMNVRESTHVISMPTALTSKVTTLASAKLDTLATEHHAKVNILRHFYYSS